MKTMLGMIFGLVGGWVVGYVVMTRCQGAAGELAAEGNPFVGIGQFACSAMVPTAPDTILFSIVGGLVGLCIGVIVQTRGKRRQER